MNDSEMCGYLMMLCGKKSRPSRSYVLALLVTHLTTATYKWQRGLCQHVEMNVFCLCTWPDLSCFSPSYIMARAPGLSLYRAGVLYLEPDLYTNTYTTGEDAMSVLFPCRNCQQYNHLPTLQCAFKDSIQKQRKRNLMKANNNLWGVSEWKNGEMDGLKYSEPGHFKVIW